MQRKFEVVAMYCYKCGKEIEDETRSCPYCGANQPIHTSSSQSSKPQYNMLCVLGFAVSCISLFIDPRGLCAITGIILSTIGMLNAKKKHEKGKVFAVLGIAIGAVEIVLTAIWMNQMYEYAMGMLDDLT